MSEPVVVARARTRRCKRTIASLLVAGCGPTTRATIDTESSATTSISDSSGLHSAEDAEVETGSTVTSTSGALADASTTETDPPPLSEPPPLRWVRAYTLESGGSIDAVELSANNIVTLAGGVVGALTSVLPSGEVDLVGPGSFVLRYQDDALAWEVLDGGRSNALLDVLPDGAVVTVGGYDDDLGGVFGAESAQPIVLPPTDGEGLYVARYTGEGALAWVLAASDGNPVAVHASLDPFGALVVLGYINTGAVFQPDGATVGEGYFRARYGLDAPSLTLEAGVVPIEPVSRPWTYNWWLRGPEFWPDGSSVFAGNFCGTLLVAPGEPNATEIVSDPPECGDVNARYANDGFLARYGPEGTLDWLITPVAPGGVNLSKAHVAVDGGVVLVGSTTDALELVDTHGAVESVQGPSSFLAAFEQDGALAWLRPIETSYTPSSIAPTPDGGIVAVGFVLESVTIEPGTTRELTLTGPGIYGIHYDASGELRWGAMLLEGATNDSAPLVSVGDGVFVISGAVTGKAVLAPGGADEIVLTADHVVALFEL